MPARPHRNGPDPLLTKGAPQCSATIMLVASLFWALTFLCCGFAALFGGRAGRRIATITIMAVLATSLVTLDERSWLEPQIPALLVDATLFVGLCWIALRSDRWFPIWYAGLQLVAVASHFGSILAPGFAPKLYFLLQSVWALPMYVALIAGVILDRRAGICDEPVVRPAVG